MYKSISAAAGGATEVEAGTVERISRRLSEAQRRTLAAIDERQAFNAVSIAPRISTAKRLEAIGVIERGACGLADARLTSLGRAIRAELLETAN